MTCLILPLSPSWHPVAEAGLRVSMRAVASCDPASTAMATAANTPRTIVLRCMYCPSSSPHVDCAGEDIPDPAAVRETPGEALVSVRLEASRTSRSEMPSALRKDEAHAVVHRRERRLGGLPRLLRTHREQPL